MNKHLLVAICFYLTFLVGCKTQIFALQPRYFSVYAINLQPEAILSFKAKVDEEWVGHGEGYDFGQFGFRASSGCRAFGSKPKKLTVKWTCNSGEGYTKTIKIPKAASDIVRGRGERILVFVTKNQIPLVFIDVRDPTDIGRPIFYDIAGNKLNDIEHDVLNLSRGFKQENVTTEILNTTLKRMELKMSPNITEEKKAKVKGSAKVKGAGAKNEIDTVKTESKTIDY